MPGYSSTPNRISDSRSGGEKSVKADGAEAYENHRTGKDVGLSQVAPWSHHDPIAKEHHDIIQKVRALKFWLVLCRAFDHDDQSIS